MLSDEFQRDEGGATLQLSWPNRSHRKQLKVETFIFFICMRQILNKYIFILVIRQANKPNF